jgi:hypothetical protein
MGIVASVSGRQGRSFGLTIGFVLLGLGSVAWWRGRDIVAGTFWLFAVVLLLGALFVPSLLRPVERLWMRLAELMSRITTPLAVAFVYFVVISPIGIVMRVVGRKPLGERRHRGTFWIDRDEARRSDLRRQF